jgi:nucleotide-binding universal stress UspA family protein
VADLIFAVLVLITWVSVGLFSVVFFLARHGRRSPYWYVLGVVLGPILLPIAAELGPTGSRVLHPASGRAGEESGEQEGTQPGVDMTVLIALDGSEESDHAAREAARVVARGNPWVVLLAVLDPDDASPAQQAAAESMLRARAAWFTSGGTACEVVTGDPVPVILDRAAVHHADVLVLGRRGRGFSRMLLGSVADRLVRRSPYPVMLGTPVQQDHGLSGPVEPGASPRDVG